MLRIQQAYRFALAPTPEQEAFLAACCGRVAVLVQPGPRARQGATGASAPPATMSTCRGPTRACAWRSAATPSRTELAPWRGEVVTGSYQAGLEALGKALQNFSRGRAAGRRVGFPRFRAQGSLPRGGHLPAAARPRQPARRRSTAGSGRCTTKESLRKLTRLLASDPQARVLRSTVQRSSGGWVISFTVRALAQAAPRARRPNAVVGVDVGLTRLATLSTGDTARERAAVAGLPAVAAPLAAPARPPAPGQQPRQLPRGRTRQATARRPGSRARGWSAPSSASPSSTRAWRTCAASRPTSSPPRSCASSA